MCELLGASFNKYLHANFAFAEFASRSRTNPHGWGLCMFNDRGADIYKESVAAYASEVPINLIEYGGLYADILIGHIRLASVGAVSYKNCHPFIQDIRGFSYTFAHNGTYIGPSGRHGEELCRGRRLVLGATDSERVFAHICHKIDKAGVKEWNDETFDWLHALLQELNQSGVLNLLISEGKHLFAYHDRYVTNSLWYLKRQAPFTKIRLKTMQIEVDLRNTKDASQEGYLVATQPLTNERGWTAFKPSELIVFKKGQIVYSSHSKDN